VKFVKYILIISLLLTSFFLSYANSISKNDSTGWFTGSVDTNWIEDQSDRLTIRLFTSRKFSRYGIMDFVYNQDLQYNPNDRIMLGMGFSYGILTIDIGLNIPSINNKDVPLYGKTKSLDLQTHFYMRKFVIDLYYHKYEGFYLENSIDMIRNWPSSDTFLIREDMKTRGLGVNIQYIFNNSRFSYRAAFNQTDWQKKSAGSFIAGIESYGFTTTGNKSLIPDSIINPAFWEGTRYDRSKIFCLGLNGGYAHTFVIKKKLFFTLSLLFGISGGNTTLNQVDINQTDLSSFTFNASMTARFAMGYNSSKLYAGIVYANLRLRNQAPPEEAWLNFDTGIVRFILAKKFQLKKPIKFLEPWKYYF
jgi:hypothetical protein